MIKALLENRKALKAWRCCGYTELEEVGFWDQTNRRIGGDGISVIEWAEKAVGRLPEETIKVRLKSLGEEKREIQ